MKTKFVKIPIKLRLPEPGTIIVFDKKGNTMTSRFSETLSTPEFWAVNYECFLEEVVDAEEDIKDVIEDVETSLNNSINVLSEARERIQYYKQEIKRLTDEKPILQEDTNE